MQTVSEKKLNEVQTIEQAINYPTLSKQIKAKSYAVVIVEFIAELQRGLDGFNVKTTMTPAQIEMFVEDFLHLYKYESIADIKICLRNARMGQYGAHFNSIDSLRIMEWFKLYLNQKAEQREKAHNKAKQVQDKPLEVVSGAKLTSEQFKALKTQIQPTRKTKKGNGLGSVMRKKLEVKDEEE